MMVTQRHARRLKVLVVDASPAWRKRLGDLTADQLGVRSVSSASSPREAMDLILKKKPNVILLGIASDELCEIEVLLSAKRKTPATFVVVNVDRFSPRLQLKYLAAGADLFLIRAELMGRLPTILATLQTQSLPREVRHPLRPRLAAVSRRRS